MFAVDAVAGNELVMKFFGATTDAQEAGSPVIADLPATDPEVCETRLFVEGGNMFAGVTQADPTFCPPGSYYDAEEKCPTWWVPHKQQQPLPALAWRVGRCPAYRQLSVTARILQPCSTTQY